MVRVVEFNTNDLRFRTCCNLMHIETAAAILSTIYFLYQFEQIFYASPMMGRQLDDDSANGQIFLRSIWYLFITLPSAFCLFALKEKRGHLLLVPIASSALFSLITLVYGVVYIYFIYLDTDTNRIADNSLGNHLQEFMKHVLEDDNARRQRGEVGMVQRQLHEVATTLFGEKANQFLFGINLLLQLAFSALITYVLVRTQYFVQEMRKHENSEQFDAQMAVTNPNFTLIVARDTTSMPENSLAQEEQDYILQRSGAFGHKPLIVLIQSILCLAALFGIAFGVVLLLAIDQLKWERDIWTALYIATCISLIAAQWRKSPYFYLPFIAFNGFAMIDLVNVGLWYIGVRDYKFCEEREADGMLYCNSVYTQDSAKLFNSDSANTFVTYAIERFLFFVFQVSVDEETKKLVSGWPERRGNEFYFKFSIFQEVMTIFTIFSEQAALFAVFVYRRSDKANAQQSGELNGSKEAEASHIPRSLAESSSLLVGLLGIISGYKLQEMYGLYFLCAASIFFGLLFERAYFYIPFLAINAIVIVIRAFDEITGKAGVFVIIYVLLTLYLLFLEFALLTAYLVLRKLIREKRNTALKTFMRQNKAPITTISTSVTKTEPENGLADAKVDGVDISSLLKNSGYLHFNGRVLKFNSEQLRYLCTLGEGTASRVYKCELLSYEGRAFAVKCMSFADGCRSRVIKDIQTMHSCRNEHITACYGYLLCQRYALICMELMSTSLADLLAQHYPQGMDEGRVADIGCRIASGMQYLKEAKNIVHGDIKPLNILLDRKGRAKLSDFDTSTPLKNSLAVVSLGRHGFHQWIAPERIDNCAQFGVKSDIWSLGLSLLQASLGKYPFGDVVAGDLEQKQIEDLKTAIRTRCHAIPVAQASISFKLFVNRCLQKKPENRPDLRELLNMDFLKGARNRVVQNQSENANKL